MLYRLEWEMMESMSFQADGKYFFAFGQQSLLLQESPEGIGGESHLQFFYQCV